MLPILQPTADLIQQDFQLDNIPNWDNEADLLAFLEEVIAYLLEHQRERLFSILYRMDVGERYVHAALDPMAILPPAQALAKLVWERECEKVITRNYYQTTDDDEEDITRW